MSTRTNQVVNPTFASNVTDGWATYNGTYGTIAWESAEGNFGTGCASATSIGATGQLYGINLTSGGSYTVGKTYMVSAYVKLKTLAGGSVIPGVWGDGAFGTGVTADGTWRRVYRRFVATTTSPLIAVLDQSQTLGNTFYIDNVMVEQVEDALPHSYFDGSFNGCSWSGSANNSASTYVESFSIELRDNGSGTFDVALSTGPTEWTSTATGITVPITALASAGATTKPSTATGVTVSPTAAATAAAIVDTASATGVTVSPAALASGTVTRVGAATGTTVSPTTSAALGAVTKGATANTAITPFAGTNLFPNSGVETDITGWTGYGSSTCARILTEHYSGAAAARSVSIATTSLGWDWVTTGLFTVGNTYLANLKFKVGNGDRVTNWSLVIDGQTANSGVVSLDVWNDISVLIPYASSASPLAQFFYTAGIAIGNVVYGDEFFIYDVSRNILTAADGTATKAVAATAVTVSPASTADGFVTRSSAATAVTVTPTAAAVATPMWKSQFSGLVVRRNLGPNPAFEVDLKGWQTYVNSTITRVTTGQYSGAGAVQITCTADGAFGLANTGTTATRPQVEAGKSYMVSCVIKLVSGTPSVSMYFWNGGLFFPPTYAFLGNSSTYSRISLGFTAIATGDLTLAIGKAIGGLAGDSFLVDEVLIEEIQGDFSFPLQYFDGDVSSTTYFYEQSHGWDGTPHESPSFISFKVIPHPLVEPITAADGDVSSGSGTWYGDTAVTVTPTSAAAGTVSKPQGATGTIVSPTTAAAPTFLTKAATASDTLVSPTTTAAGVVTHLATALNTQVSPAPVVAAGAIVKTQASTGVTVSPAPAAVPLELTKTTSATGITVSPTVAAARAAASITGAATQSAVSPTTNVIPLPIVDFASADLLVSPSVTAVAGAITKSAAATGVTITPTTSAVPLPITDTASASVAVTPTSLASGTVAKSSTVSVSIAATVTADGGAITKSASTALTVSPAPLAGGTASKPQSATGVSITPTTAAALGAVVKSASATSAIGSSGSPVLRDAAQTYPFWINADFETTTVHDFVFDTTGIPEGATITSWSINGSMMATGVDSADWDCFWSRVGDGSSPVFNPGFNLATWSWAYVPTIWRGSAVTYSLTIEDLYGGGSGVTVRVDDAWLEVSYVASGIITTATLGPKTSTGAASASTSPSTAAVGDTGVIVALSIAPSTTAALGAVTKATTASTSVSPTTAAAGTVSKPQAATAVTLSPATAASGQVTSFRTAALVVSPTPTAAPGAITKTQAATGITLNPVAAATPQALSKASDVDVTVSPVSAAAGTVLKASSAALAITPTSLASPGAVSKPASVSVVVTPTTTAVPTPITDTAFVTITVSPTTAATIAPIVDLGLADITVTPVSAATAGVIVKATSASVTSVTPSSFASPATQGDTALTISPQAQASGSVTRFATADTTITPTPSTVVPLRTAMAALAFTVSLATSAEGSRTTYATADAVIEALSDAHAVYEALGHADTTISPVSWSICGQDWFADALAVIVVTQTRVETRQRRAQHWGSLRI